MDRFYLNGDDWLMKEFVGMDWVWRNSVMMDTKDTRWWNKASVPGSVLNDLFCDGLVENPYFELNSKLVEWVPARTWVYRKKFRVPLEWREKQIWLCLEGIDYEGEIFLNGISLGSHKGMYLPWTKEISKDLFYEQDNLLAIVIEPAPPEQPQVGKTSLVSTHKSRMTYWWDFCPRMIHQGIWDDVYLKATLENKIEDVSILYQLNEEYSKAEVEVVVETKGDKQGMACVSFGEEKKEVPIKEGRGTATFTIQNPNLWWPNGYGSQFQYKLSVSLYNKNGEKSDCYDKKVGIRKIVFENNENAPEDAPKYLLYVNGRKIYMNGYNWVPMDVMYGVERKEKLERLIHLAKNANVNIFRVWGGGLIEKDSFYETCAKAGILIWQEFILSSSGIDNKTPENKAYYHMMKEQASIIIKRKRNHTALAIWCGGNELQDENGNPLDNKDKLLSMLKEQAEFLDSSRKWFPTSPSGGVFLNTVETIKNNPDRLFDVHGPWEHQGLDKHCKLYNMGTSLLHSEFGVEGMTNRNVLYNFTSKEHFMPASKDNEIYFHRGAWWNNEPLVQETFGGSLEDIDKIRKASQYMQYEGMKYAVECNRRRAFRNSGSFPWQFNEPYPNLYCTCHIDYDGNPKPVYYGMKTAYAPVVITASFDSPSFTGQDNMNAEIYIGTSYIESDQKAKGSFQAVIQLAAEDGTIFYEERIEKELSYNKTEKAASIHYDINKIPSSLVLLRLFVEQKNEIVAKNEYLFTKEKSFKRLFEMQEPELEVKERNNKLWVKNNGNAVAYFVHLSEREYDENRETIYLQENYFCLLPEEEREIQVSCKKGENLFHKLAAEAMNVSYHSLEGEV